MSYAWRCIPTIAKQISRVSNPLHLGNTVTYCILTTSTALNIRAYSKNTSANTNKLKHEKNTANTAPPPSPKTKNPTNEKTSTTPTNNIDKKIPPIKRDPKQSTKVKTTKKQPRSTNTDNSNESEPKDIKKKSKTAVKEKTTTHKQKEKKTGEVKAPRKSKANQIRIISPPLELPPYPQFLVDNKSFAICQLAETTDKIIYGRDYFLEPKLDGVRVITFVTGGRYRMFSRNAKEYKFFNIKFVNEIFKIHENLQAKYNEDWNEFVLDGEMMTKDHSFTSVSGLGHSKNISTEGMKYYVFDIIKLSDYLDKGPKMSQRDRKSILDSVLALPTEEVVGEEPHSIFNRVVRLPYEEIMIKDAEMIKQLVAQYVQSKYEGIILKQPNCLHQRRRHFGILKAKMVSTYDLRIKQVEEGQGKFKDTLGAFVLQSANDKIVKVGSGMSDELRRKFWRERENLIGKIVEISAQELTKNSLRFPVFVKIRDDKDEPDTL